MSCMLEACLEMTRRVFCVWFFVAGPSTVESPRLWQQLKLTLGDALMHFQHFTPPSMPPWTTMVDLCHATR